VLIRFFIIGVKTRFPKEEGDCERDEKSKRSNEKYRYIGVLPHILRGKKKQKINVKVAAISKA
jgi:hypothetical protein